MADIRWGDYNATHAHVLFNDARCLLSVCMRAQARLAGWLLELLAPPANGQRDYCHIPD